MKKNIVKDIRMLILDVDGVLTNGKIIISNQGDEYKQFDIKDGLGIVLLQNIGVKVAILTSQKSEIVTKRFINLGLIPEDILQNQKNKINGYNLLKTKYAFEDKNIAYMGDDLPDIALMHRAGLSASPSNCTDIVKKYADYICNSNSGHGATREFCEYIIKSKGIYNKVISDYLNRGEVA